MVMMMMKEERGERRENRRGRCLCRRLERGRNDSLPLEALQWRPRLWSFGHGVMLELIEATGSIIQIQALLDGCNDM